MTALTPNYDPNPLHPRLIIRNLSGGSAYTFESKQLVSNPTQDFKVETIKLHLGVNSDFGSMQIVIHDHDGILTDTSKDSRPGVIGGDWSIELFLGKSLATEERWFYGKIKDVITTRPTTNLQFVSLSCVGWGVILRERMTRLVRNQKKLSDGVTLDTTDTSTKISALLLDLFQDTDHYVDNNISQISTITAQTSTTGNGIDEDDTGSSIANVNFNIVPFAQAISNLVGITNSMWHINADRSLVVQDPDKRDSGFLFTNNLASDKAQNWESTKIGYILNAPLEWQDTSADMMYNIVHGFGHFSPGLNTSDGQTPDAADNLDTDHHAIPFTVTSDNIMKVAIRSIRTGTPATDGSVQIWGDTGGSGPDPDDVRYKKILNSTTLQALGTTTPADWFEIPIRPRLSVTPNEQLYLVFPRFGTSTNTFSVNYKSGSGTFWDSTDGTTWTSRVGQSAYRIYDAKRLITTVENTTTTALLPAPKERAFPIRSDLEEQTVRETMIQAAAILGKRRRTYGKVIISPVTARIPLGAFCELQDIKTGLNVKVNIMAIDLTVGSGTGGVDRIELTLDSFGY
jgi:hypothetical protein